MGQIRVDLSLTLEVPDTGLTVNGLLRSVWEMAKPIARAVTSTLLEAIEEREIERMREGEPARYVRNGHVRRPRTFRGSMGEVTYRLTQLRDRQGSGKKKTVLPLRRALSLDGKRRIAEEATEAGIGQVVHVSYRRSAKEIERIRGDGISASTLHRRLAEFSDAHCRFGDLRDIPYRFLMVDGTGCLIQGPNASKQKAGEMRWALASRGEGQPFEPVGVWVNTSWNEIKKDLKTRMAYEKLELLLTDGEPACEVFLEEGMRHQRCAIHGKREFAWVLYQDGLKKPAQEPLREKMAAIPVFQVSKENLEALRPEDRESIEKRVEDTKKAFQSLLEVLDPAVYPKAHVYVKNLVANVRTFFDWWLETGKWIPFSTNAVESTISLVKNRVRRVGRRWSEHGLLRWLQVAVSKILLPATWDGLWRQYLALNPGLRLLSLEVAYRWI